MNCCNLFVEKWKVFLSSSKNILLLIFSFSLMVVMLHFIARFIISVEQRPGFAFDDPFLNLFDAINLTWLIFLFLYFSVCLAIFFLIQEPKELVFAFLAYSLLLAFRIFCMFLLPLDPPKGIILLKDPIIEYFGTEITLTKDLFFSGHTSLMVLLFLLVNNKWAKAFLLGATFVVGFGVLLQKAHYTVDVVVAVFAAFCSYEWTKRVLIAIKFFTK